MLYILFVVQLVQITFTNSIVFLQVADFNGDMRKTLFRAQLDEPRAIAVYPSEGWMFWTDWGQEAKIERAGMNGIGREVSTVLCCIFVCIGVINNSHITYKLSLQ